jgi:putative polyhydroxyalkanoate system protein
LASGDAKRYHPSVPVIRIWRSHRLSDDHVRRTAETIARRIEQRHPVRWRWDGDSLELHAPEGPARGTRGRVTIDGALLAIELHLPLALSPLKGLVEGRLSAKLDEILGPAGAY